MKLPRWRLSGIRRIETFSDGTKVRYKADGTIEMLYDDDDNTTTTIGVDSQIIDKNTGQDVTGDSITKEKIDQAKADLERQAEQRLLAQEQAEREKQEQLAAKRAEEERKQRLAEQQAQEERNRQIQLEAQRQDEQARWVAAQQQNNQATGFATPRGPSGPTAPAGPKGPFLTTANSNAETPKQKLYDSQYADKIAADMKAKGLTAGYDNLSGLAATNASNFGVQFEPIKSAEIKPFEVNSENIDRVGVLHYVDTKKAEYTVGHSAFLIQLKNGRIFEAGFSSNPRGIYGWEGMATATGNVPGFFNIIERDADYFNNPKFNMALFTMKNASSAQKQAILDHIKQVSSGNSIYGKATAVGKEGINKEDYKNSLQAYELSNNYSLLGMYGANCSSFVNDGLNRAGYKDNQKYLGLGQGLPSQIAENLSKNPNNWEKIEFNKK